MSSAALAELIGSQVPTHWTVPAYVSTSGGEAADLAAMYGVALDPWQRLELDGGLGEAADGSWSAREVAQILARQNGKNVVFEAREMFGLYVLAEPLILHTAHQYKTAQESFRQIIAIIDNYDWFRRKVKRITRTNGEEAVELLNGARLRFLARSLASGRGFRVKTLMLDEAYELDDDAMSALMPTLSAQRNTQTWYGSSAGMRRSVQLGRIWRRIRRAYASGVPDPFLAGYEWAADLCTVFCRSGCDVHDDPADPAVWAKTNPGLGIEHANGTMLELATIEKLFTTMGREAFVREILSVGDYPLDATEQWAVISEAAWTPLADPGSTARDPVAFAVEVGAERRFTSIAAAGERRDGLMHVEVVDYGPGTDWVTAKMVDLARKHRPCAVIIDPGSHAGALIDGIERAGVEVTKPFSARDAAAACGQFYDLVRDKELRYFSHPDSHVGALNAALAGATTRSLSDAWAWDRRAPSIEISPLVAVTLAAWGFAKFGRTRKAPYDLEKSVA